MFYDGLSEEVVNNIIAQDFEPTGQTTLHQLAEWALKIDKKHLAAGKKKTCIMSSAHHNKISFTSNTYDAKHEQLKKGDKVCIIGTDGHAKKGITAEISKNSHGKNVLNVKWNWETNMVQVAFGALIIDMRPNHCRCCMRAHMAQQRLLTEFMGREKGTCVAGQCCQYLMCHQAWSQAIRRCNRQVYRKQIGVIGYQVEIQLRMLRRELWMPHIPSVWKELHKSRIIQ